MDELGITLNRASEPANSLQFKPLKGRLRPDGWVLERPISENFFQLSKQFNFVYDGFYYKED